MNNGDIVVTLIVFLSFAIGIVAFLSQQAMDWFQRQHADLDELASRGRTQDAAWNHTQELRKAAEEARYMQAELQQAQARARAMAQSVRTPLPSFPIQAAVDIQRAAQVLAGMSDLNARTRERIATVAERHQMQVPGVLLTGRETVETIPVEIGEWGLARNTPAWANYRRDPIPAGRLLPIPPSPAAESFIAMLLETQKQPVIAVQPDYCAYCGKPMHLSNWPYIGEVCVCVGCERAWWHVPGGWQELEGRDY